LVDLVELFFEAVPLFRVAPLFVAAVGFFAEAARFALVPFLALAFALFAAPALADDALDGALPLADRAAADFAAFAGAGDAAAETTSDWPAKITGFFRRLTRMRVAVDVL
jgi:hypothetical protein